MSEGAWAGLAGAMMLAAGFAGLALMGPVYTSSDEYCRLHYAILWSRDPFFAPWDHIWLGGNFWLLGPMVGVLGDAVAAGIVFGLASAAAAGVGVYTLLRGMELPRPAALAGVAIVATRPVVMALAKSPQPDLLFFGLLFLAVAGMAWHVRGGMPVSRPSWPWAGATLAVMAAQSLRYEAWYFTVVFGLVALGFFGVCLYRRRWRAAALWVPLGLALAVMPLLWFWSSARTLGSPFAFVDNVSRMLLMPTPELDLGRPWHRFLYYPFYGFWQSPVVLVAGAAGLAMALWRGTAGTRVAAGALAAFLLILLVNTTLKGTGNNWPWRYGATFLVPAAVFVPVLGTMVLRHVGGRWLAVAVSVLVLAEVVYTAGRFPGLFHNHPPREEIVRLGDYLAEVGYPVGGAPVVVGLDQVGLEGFVDYDVWVAAVHAGPVYAIRPARTAGDWRGVLEDGGTRAVLARTAPGAGWRRERERGEYTLSVREPGQEWTTGSE